MRDLIPLFPWLNVLWFSGMCSFLAYDCPQLMFPTHRVRRRANRNDRAIAAGILAAAHNWFRIAGLISDQGESIQELWLEGRDFAPCRWFWQMSPNSRRILSPHDTNSQCGYNQNTCDRQMAAWRQSRKTRWRRHVAEWFLGDAVALQAIRWDDILTLHEAPSMGVPVTDFSGQLTEDVLRDLAGRLPTDVVSELTELQKSLAGTNTTLLLLGNLGDQYLDAEIATYIELVQRCRSEYGATSVLVKPHPRHPLEVVQRIVGAIRDAYPDLSFRFLDRLDRLPLELIMPFLQIKACVAGWTSSARTVAVLKRVPVFVGVSRLKPLVFQEPSRAEMFDEFVMSYLPRFAQVF